MIATLAVANYRSLRNLVLPLRRINLITGANGSGKSNLYRALRLLAETAQGGAVAAVAHEGGLPSVVWAGPEGGGVGARRPGDPTPPGSARREPVGVRLGFGGDPFGYSVEFGLPPQVPGDPSLFKHDPHIKRECIWMGAVYRPSHVLVDRDGPLIRVMDKGRSRIVETNVSPFDCFFGRVASREHTPEVLDLRDAIRGWRFYDHFRTDADAPVRRAQIGTRTPVLGHDGSNLAAAIETIREIGDRSSLDAAVADAFPGGSLSVESMDGRFSLSFHQNGLLRPPSASELSDGTLRYIFWIAALLTPRPPALMVLNEPETGIHPDLYGPFARLVAELGMRTQIWVISHAPGMVKALSELDGCSPISLRKDLAETRVVDQGLLDAPVWSWPRR